MSRWKRFNPVFVRALNRGPTGSRSRRFSAAVSIPSSSGHFIAARNRQRRRVSFLRRFQSRLRQGTSSPRHRQEVAEAIHGSFNPVFVRALHRGTASCARDERVRSCFNPVFVRALHRGANDKSNGQERHGLFQSRLSPGTSTSTRVRSASVSVSIPSSSGHFIAADCSGQGHRRRSGRVSIPSSSGHFIAAPAAYPRGQEIRVSFNPVFVRAIHRGGFGILAGLASLIRVSIPSSSGHFTR